MRFRIIVLGVSLSAILFSGSLAPNRAWAVAGSSYVQCLAVVSAEMSALLAAGTAIPSVIAGTVSASLTLNLQSYVLALGAEICAQGTNEITAISSVASALHSDISNAAKLEDASATHKFLLEQRLRGEKDFGTNSTVTHVCSRSFESTQSGSVLQSVASTFQTTNRVANKWMKQDIPKSTALMKISSQPGSNFDATNLFGTSDVAGGSTLSPSQVQAGQNFVLNVTDPVPYAAQAPTGTTGVGGQRETVASLRDHAVLSLARQALNEQLALRTPFQNPNLLQWQNTLAQEENLPPVSGSSGISLMTLIGTDVHSRFSSPSWLTELHTLSPTGVLRETALEGALEIEIEWQQLLADQKMESLLAAIAAKQVSIRRH